MAQQHRPPRILVIGGGSVTWGPVLLGDIALHPALQEAQVVLYDIDAAAAERIAALARRLYKAAGCGNTVTVAHTLQEGLNGADFILPTISVGLLDTMELDLEIPARFRIHQTVGDTVGPGGWARALRHIPVMEDLSRKILEICPQAWLLNLTNPMTVLTRAACKLGVKTIGLCHEVDNYRPTLANSLGVAEESLKVRVAGINHLPWALGIWVDGKDAYPAVKELCRKDTFSKIFAVVDYEYMNPFDDYSLVKARITNEFGFFPMAGDRHLVEFFPYFLTGQKGWGREFGVKLTPIEYRKQVQYFMGEYIHSLIDGSSTIELTRSREAVSDVIAALWGCGGGEYVVNIPNRGQIENLPRDVVVECQALVEHDRVVPIHLGTIPPVIEMLCRRYIVIQEMVVAAALEQDREKAVQALLLDPMIRDLDDGRAMAGELLEAQKEWIQL